MLRLGHELSDLEDKAEHVAELVEELQVLEGQRSAQDVALTAENMAWAAIQAGKLAVAQLEATLTIAKEPGGRGDEESRTWARLERRLAAPR